MEVIEQSNQHILNATGLSIHVRRKKPTLAKKYKKMYHHKREKIKLANRLPIIKPGTNNKLKVKQQTGLTDVIHLLYYIIIVCDANLDVMKEHVS